MKSFKLQNACILVAIILIDAVVYLLMGELLSGDLSFGQLLSMTLYLWHGVNLILIGYLIYLTVKNIGRRKAVQIVKNSKK